MTRLTSLIFFLLASGITFAQAPAEEVSGSYSRPSYLSISTGMNNSVGFLGVSYEKRFVQSFALEGGAGMSTWGVKLNAQAKIYFVPYSKRWGFGAGMTYSNGYRNKKDDLYVVTPGLGSQLTPTSVNYVPQFSAHASVYHYYKIDEATRFYLQLGWSLNLSSDKIVANRGAYLNEQSTEYINTVFLRAPGGPLFACGFSFRISGGKKRPA